MAGALMSQPSESAQTARAFLWSVHSSGLPPRHPRAAAGAAVAGGLLSRSSSSCFGASPRRRRGLRLRGLGLLLLGLPPRLPERLVALDLGQDGVLHLRRDVGQQFKGGLDDVLYEADLRARELHRVAVAHRRHRHAQAFLLLALREELLLEALNPHVRQSGRLRGRRDVGRVEHHHLQRGPRGEVGAPGVGVGADLLREVLEVAHLREVLRHVRAQHHLDHLLPDPGVHLGAEAGEEVGVLLAAEQPEGLRDVVVLQHAPVVVGQRELVPRVDVEHVVPAVVAHVVDDGAQHQGHRVQRVEARREADIAQQRVHRLRHVRRVRAVVVGGGLRRRVHAFHALQEAHRLLRVEVELAEVPAPPQRLPAGELQRPPAGQLGEAEHVEGPGVKLLVQERAEGELAPGLQLRRPPGQALAALAGRLRQRERGFSPASPGRSQRRGGALPAAVGAQPGPHVVHRGGLEGLVVAVHRRGPREPRREEAVGQGRPRGVGLEAVAQEAKLRRVVPAVGRLQEPPDDAERDVQGRRGETSGGQLPAHLRGVGQDEVPALVALGCRALDALQGAEGPAALDAGGRRGEPASGAHGHIFWQPQGRPRGD
mmetsp:Transcript_8594/g.22094  ORF Transcript_8594/g.22094 Transcript_8594/m.22094 type:complete len:598 (-) Transcript_8594:1-1794(-)